MKEGACLNFSDVGASGLYRCRGVSSRGGSGEKSAVLTILTLFSMWRKKASGEKWGVWGWAKSLYDIRLPRDSRLVPLQAPSGPSS